MPGLAFLSSLSTTYLLPAIFLNPPFVLHLLNTFVSYLLYSAPDASASRHPRLEYFGPVPGSPPYFDVHADDRLCWHYTAIMVVVQLLAIGRVQDNRGRWKNRLQNSAERQKAQQQQKAAEDARGPAVMESCVESSKLPVTIIVNGVDRSSMSLRARNGSVKEKKYEIVEVEILTEGSLTETSEEDTF